MAIGKRKHVTHITKTVTQFELYGQELKELLHRVLEQEGLTEVSSHNVKFYIEVPLGGANCSLLTN